MAFSGRRDELERHEARHHVGVSGRMEERRLRQRLQGLEAQYRHSVDLTDHEATRMKEKAKDLLSEQLRLAEQLPEEETFRDYLGLARRRNSSIKPIEVLATAERFGFSSSELKRRQSVAEDEKSHGHLGLARRRNSSIKPIEVLATTERCGFSKCEVKRRQSLADVSPSARQQVTSSASSSEIHTERRNSCSKQSPTMAPFRSTHRSGGCGFSRESGGVHCLPNQRKCCSLEAEVESENRMYAELARCRYLRTSADNELSVDDVFSKD